MPIYTAEEYNSEYGHKVERYPLPKDCATSNYPRLIHGEQTWRFLQRIFYEQTYARKSYHHRLTGRYQNLWYSGVDDQYVQARDDGGRGRGMYAIKDIPEGTKVWYFNLECVVNDGAWSTKEKMTEFLERLPHDLQCDVLLWSYAVAPLYTGSTGPKYVECNLDEASFFNHGESSELINVVGSQNIAARDIKKGEELLMDYGSFIALGKDSSPWYDEIRNTAWKESEAEDSTSDNDAISKANSSRSSVPSTEADIGMSSDCMDGYVKYGAPKATTTTTTSTVFVDALSIHGAQTMCYGLSATLAGLSLAWVLARGLATMGIRRRR
jgi:hypothetical protein